MYKNPHSNNLLLNLGIDSLNEMQLAAQETILSDSNVLLLSPTGSGKTLAFLLPIFEMLNPDINTRVQCLILVPSRELGLQIEQVWKKMGTDYKVNVCYGGHSIETEIKNLSNPPAVLIERLGELWIILTEALSKPIISKLWFWMNLINHCSLVFMNKCHLSFQD